MPDFFQFDRYSFAALAVFQSSLSARPTALEGTKNQRSATPSGSGFVHGSQATSADSLKAAKAMRYSILPDLQSTSKLPNHES